MTPTASARVLSLAMLLLGCAPLASLYAITASSLAWCTLLDVPAHCELRAAATATIGVNKEPMTRGMPTEHGRLDNGNNGRLVNTARQQQKQTAESTKKAHRTAKEPANRDVQRNDRDLWKTLFRPASAATNQSSSSSQQPQQQQQQQQQQQPQPQQRRPRHGERQSNRDNRTNSATQKPTAESSTDPYRQSMDEYILSSLTAFPAQHWSIILPWSISLILGVVVPCLLSVGSHSRQRQRRRSSQANESDSDEDEHDAFTFFYHQQSRNDEDDDGDDDEHQDYLRHQRQEKRLKRLIFAVQDHRKVRINVYGHAHTHIRRLSHRIVSKRD